MQWQRFLPPQTVLARNQCLYRFFPWFDVPKAERNNVLDLKIRQWTPWANARCWIVPDKIGAMVWAWQDEANTNFPSHTIPETLLQPRRTQGLWVLNNQQGYELQYWDQGLLLHSLWQDHPFSSTEQIRWCELLGLSNSPTNIIEQEELHPVPWANNTAKTTQNSLNTLKWGMALTSICIAALYAYWITDWYKWHKENTDLEQQYSSLLTSLRPIIEQRNLYDQATKKLNAIHDLASSQPHVQLFQYVLPALQQARCAPCELIEWHYDSTVLELAVTAEKLEQKTLVEQLYKNPQFKKVSIPERSEKGQVGISIELAEIIAK